MRKLFTAALLLTTAIATPAFAQDGEPEEFNGVYVGGSFGTTFPSDSDDETILFDRGLDGTFGDTINTPTNPNAFSTGFCSGTVSGSTRPSSGCSSSDPEVEFSGRIGFDRQMGNFVVGALVEVGKTDASSSVTAFSTTPASYTITREIDYLANLRARIGFTATPTTLVYATAGVAYAKLDNSFTTTNTVNSVTPSGDDGDSLGYVLGLGVEQKLGRNVSIGVEYLYQQLQDDDFSVRLGARTGTPTNSPFLIGSPNGTDFIRSEDKFSMNSLRAVVNFRF